MFIHSTTRCFLIGLIAFRPSMFKVIFDQDFSQCGRLEQDATDRMVYKQRYIALCAGSWKPEIRVSACSGSAGGSVSGSQAAPYHYAQAR